MEGKIKELFKKVLKIKDSDFNDRLSQDSCMNWDSVNHLTIITELEKMFNIKFSVDDVLSMVNVKAVKERVRKRVNG